MVDRHDGTYQHAAFRNWASGNCRIATLCYSHPWGSRSMEQGICFFSSLTLTAVSCSAVPALPGWAASTSLYSEHRYCLQCKVLLCCITTSTDIELQFFLRAGLSRSVSSATQRTALPSRRHHNLSQQLDYTKSQDSSEHLWSNYQVYPSRGCRVSSMMTGYMVDVSHVFSWHWTDALNLKVIDWQHVSERVLQAMTRKACETFNISSDL